jgi:hypothetical protein
MAAGRVQGCWVRGRRRGPFVDVVEPGSDAALVVPEAAFDGVREQGGVAGGAFVGVGGSSTPSVADAPGSKYQARLPRDAQRARCSRSVGPGHGTRMRKSSPLSRSWHSCNESWASKGPAPCISAGPCARGPRPVREAVRSLRVRGERTVVSGPAADGGYGKCPSARAYGWFSHQRPHSDHEFRIIPKFPDNVVFHAVDHDSAGIGSLVSLDCAELLTSFFVYDFRRSHI